MNVALNTALVGSASAQRTWHDGVAEVLPPVFEEGCENLPTCQLLEEGMAYRYYLPQNYDPAVEYPLVLFLHGSGESGANNISHVTFIPSLIEKTDAEFPAILVAPQLVRPSGWGPPVNSDDRTDEVLDDLVDRFSVDTDRLYVTGFSMGGFGAVNYVDLYNRGGLGDFRFAAASPYAGAFVNEGAAAELSETPIWIAHGSVDAIVPVRFARESYNLLIGADRFAPIALDDFGGGGPMAASGSTRYTEFPGRNHVPTNPLYASDDFYEWLFAQSLEIPEPSSLGLACAALLFRPITGRRPRTKLDTPPLAA